MSKKSFVGGAVILMIAGFFVRILGFVYRIYLSNLIGAEGMGLFQLIFPIYSLIILTLTSGISIAVSKMVAAELAQNHIINLRRITRCAFALVVCAGTLVSIVLYLYSGFISHNILKDDRTYYSLVLLIPSIPVIAAASAIKGYFYGIQDVIPTAVSQIVEQVVRITIVMIMAAYFINLGLEYACALATIAMAIGEISNLAVVFLVYKFRKSKELKNYSRYGFIRKRKLIKEILSISIPVSFNRFITSSMSAVELILIPRRLLAGGLHYEQSIAEYGRLTGMANPLIFFPSLVTSSLATTLVPAISEAISLKSFRSVNYRISKSIQFTFILGFIFTVIFMCYPDEISSIIYKREKIGPLLYDLSFTCIFTYLQQTLLGILNGLGKQGISLINLIIGYAIRIGFVYYCIPLYGVHGYIWGIIISTFCVCFLNLYTVTKTTGMSIDIRNWVLKPGFVGIIMFLSGKYIYAFFTIFNAGYSWTVVLTVTGNVVIATALMVVFGALEKDELFRLLGLRKLMAKHRSIFNK